MTSRRHDLLANIEGFRDPNSFDGYIHTTIPGQRHDLLSGIPKFIRFLCA
jgi:hypothetical protein